MVVGEALLGHQGALPVFEGVFADHAAVGAAEEDVVGRVAGGHLKVVGHQMGADIFGGQHGQGGRAVQAAAEHGEILVVPDADHPGEGGVVVTVLIHAVFAGVVELHLVEKDAAGRLVGCAAHQGQIHRAGASLQLEAFHPRPGLNPHQRGVVIGPHERLPVGGPAHRAVFAGRVFHRRPVPLQLSTEHHPDGGRPDS